MFPMFVNVRENADSQLHVDSLLPFDGLTVKHLISPQQSRFLANDKANKQAWRVFSDGCVMGGLDEQRRARDE